MTQDNIHLPFDIAMPSSQQLTAGPFRCLYEHGAIRNLRVNGHLIVQTIYAALRDQNWNTAPVILQDEKIVQENNGFTINASAHYSLNNIQYQASISIAAMDGRLVFEFKGKALSTFKRNRIGICVLHPIQTCAGKEAVLEQTDGGEISSPFPDLIRPHQPFKNIRSLRWQTNGIEVSTLFEGDIFETEDQRNWSDYSFKTYSTPLELPIPVEVSQGDEVHQRVELSWRLTDNSLPRDTAKDETRKRFPLLGISVGSGAIDRYSDNNERLAFAQFMRGALHIGDAGSVAGFKTIVDLAGRLDMAVHIDAWFISGSEEELKVFQRLMDHQGSRVAAVLILKEAVRYTPSDLFERIRTGIQWPTNEVKLGYGSWRYFAELNRNPPPTPDYDFLAFGIQPQVHAKDPRSIIENLGSHASIMASVAALEPDAIIISASPPPGGVQPGSNAAARRDSKEVHVALDFTHADVPDERIGTSFAAYWLLSAIYNLAPFALTLSDAFVQQVVKGNGSMPGNVSVNALLKIIGEFKPQWISRKCDETTEFIILENGNGDSVHVSSDPKYLSIRRFETT